VRVKARTHFAVAALVTWRVLGLSRCFRSPGELYLELLLVALVARLLLGLALLSSRGVIVHVERFRHRVLHS
jgi:hypothetical protein